MPNSILLFFFLLIFTVQANTPKLLPSTVDFFRGRTLLSTDDQRPVLEKDKNIEKTLVVIDDNRSTFKLILVEALSGKQLWELNPDSPMSSSSSNVIDNGFDSHDMIRIDPTVLQYVNSGKTNLIKIMEDYIKDVEKGSKDIITEKTMEEITYIVDTHSGELLPVLNMVNSLSEIIDTDGVMNPLNPKNDLLRIKRTDCTWRIKDIIRMVGLQDIKVSTIEVIPVDQEKDPHVEVVHFYSTKAGFIQLLKSKHRMLGLPNGGNEIIMGLLEGGNSASSTLPREGGDNESLTPPLEGGNNGSLTLPLKDGNNGSFKPLPEGGIKPHTESGNTRRKLIILSIVIVFVSVVLLLVCLCARNKMEQKSANVLIGSIGKNTSSHKRKKGRKGASTKNGANTQNIGGDILYYDVEKLNGTYSDSKNRKEQWPSPGMHLGVKANGRMIGKLYISYTEIARGSNGTVVLEGVYDGRPVAIKRLVRGHNDIAHKEVQNLIASDQHPNIVRYHGVEYDSDFVYLALERCSCTLSDLIKFCSKPSSQLVSNRGNSLISCNDQLKISKEDNKSVELWKANKYPSPELLRLMRFVHNIATKIVPSITEGNIEVLEGKLSPKQMETWTKYSDSDILPPFADVLIVIHKLRNFFL